ncbi:MAG: DUF4215 domain-containing protein, partial [bacterium]|nr:DUF4215 domain-containing protein [bacterium]
PGEECDDGNQVNTDDCRHDCTLPFCGDGFVDPGEQCDDGNNTNDDGCSAECMLEVCVGTGSPGYWKNHPEAWPVGQISFSPCGDTYSKDEAIKYMSMAVKRHKERTLFRALVAAKLNVIMGTEDSCIADTITEAEAWMCEYPLGTGVRGSSDAWKVGGPLYYKLDYYNNGRLCAPSRDECEGNSDYKEEKPRWRKD